MADSIENPKLQVNMAESIENPKLQVNLADYFENPKLQVNLAESIESPREPVVKDAIPRQPAQEAPELTIENLTELGFDHELIRFAVFHTNGCIWEAADVLLRFEDRPDKGDAVARLEFALWIANNDRVKALKILAKFRSGARGQIKILQSTTPKDNAEQSIAETALKQSPFEKTTDTAQSQSQKQRVATNIDRKPVTTNATPAHPKENTSGSGVKRKISVDVIEIPDDAVLDVGTDAHDSSRRKTERRSVQNRTRAVRLSPLNEEVWADAKMKWADELFRSSKSQLVLSENFRGPLPHKFECLVRLLERKTVLPTIRKELLKIESNIFPDSKRCIERFGEISATIELKDACLHCSKTHKWLLSLDEVVVFLILNRTPSRQGLLAFITRCGSVSKLCGNKSCRRTSHIIGKSLETAASRTACQNERKRVLDGDHIPLDKCLTRHFPACMRDLTFSNREDDKNQALTGADSSII
ncbi:hypothetical protein SBOR_3695 [Sclerotinia borealis F-4128]|uniref:UBA domain-containing protein n=1 Tax=Sclerotinia borealis (strain F-4128) TaxID=1432307 RepID=W9CGN9_SCLBF|nr:hypothetical protein SBOR_3695 [Sclerotinia borealis F-4128]